MGSQRYCNSKIAVSLSIVFRGRRRGVASGRQRINDGSVMPMGQCLSGLDTSVHFYTANGPYYTLTRKSTLLLNYLPEKQTRTSVVIVIRSASQQGHMLYMSLFSGNCIMCRYGAGEKVSTCFHSSVVLVHVYRTCHVDSHVHWLIIPY